MNIIFSSIILFIFWLVYSENFILNMILLGFLSVAFISILDLRFRNLDTIWHRYVNLRFIRYLCYFFKEMYISSFMLCMYSWTSKKPNPSLNWYKMKLEDEIGKTIYANSITLTPGTITVVAEDKRFLIHAIAKEFIKEISETGMETEVRKILGNKNG